VAPRISLALALHNHQPVGNFGWVIAENCDTAYVPMLDALDRYPGVRLSLHYTGPLLEWFAAERPDILDRLRALVARGQVEILGGGYYEPVLASLPERDRVGQLVRMGDELETILGRRPRGAWLAERVWEPDLPTSLVAAGYEWTILDDAHFRAAAIPEEDLWGPYTTEDQGRLLDVFGTEQGLRYRIPFRDVEDVIAYLRDHATEDGSRVGMMGDDGEKFGAWPTTWEHCWGERRWVERFFEALEANADWLSTVTPSAWLDGHHPIGRVYIPTGSYAEMGEWALPADESVAYGALLRRAQAEHLPEARWLRGAFWRNFQVKYREVNDLHKQMLRVSDKVEAMTHGAAQERARDHLFRGQSNDCYWHGLFGGIYISHMRLATHEHLIAAEDIADTEAGGSGAAPAASVTVWDLDKDGFDEVQLSAPGQIVTIDLEEGAGIGSWDLRATRHAVLSVLRRRPEAYHAKLRALEAPHADGEGGHLAAAAASIHDVVRTTEPGLAARLRYDDHERRSGLVRFLPDDASAEDWANVTVADLSDAVDGAYELVETAAGRVVVRRDASLAGGGTVRVTKTVTLGGGRLDPALDLRVDLENIGDGAIAARVGLEWTTTMLGGGGNPSAWWDVDGERIGHDTSGTAASLGRLAQGNEHIGVAIGTAVSPPADAWWVPVETISNSEQGFERVYQGSGLLLSWPLRLEPGARWSATVSNSVTSTRDRAGEA
jgi:4-alpha-glucanotransferase